MNLLNKREWDFWKIVKICVFIYFAVFLVYPMFKLIIPSFFDSEAGGFSLEQYRRFFSRKKYLEAFWNSLNLTMWTTILSTIIGFPVAYLMSRFEIKGKKILTILIIITLMSPPFIGAYSWIILLGRNGFITNAFKLIGLSVPTIYGFGGILIVFVLKMFPFIFLYVSGALKNIDASLEEAAEGLGADKLKRIFQITTPLILPTLLGGALLVFMTSFADFGTPILLGRGFKTLPVLIYDEFVSELGGNATFASAISFIVIIFTMLVFLIQRYFVNKRSYEMTALRSVPVTKLNGINSFFAHLYIYLIVFLASIPQIIVTYTSFRQYEGAVIQPGYTINNYIEIIQKLSDTIWNSLAFSTVATFIMIFIALFVAYLSVRRRSKTSTLLDILVMTPIIIPGTIIGLMYVYAFNAGFLIGNYRIFALGQTALIMILALVLRRGPSIVRSTVAILYQIDPSVDEASISLGYSPSRTFFKISAILMLPGVVSGAVLAWVRCMSELASSIMLYNTNTRTIPIAIYNEILRANYGAAAAISTFLVVLTSVILVLFFRISKQDPVGI